MAHPTFVAAQLDYIARLNDAMRALDRRLASNIAINGDMMVWQRGTSFAASASKVVSADRWIFRRSTNATGATATRQATGLAGFQYCLRAQRDSGNVGVTTVEIAQSFETANVTQLQGLPLFLTFRARCGANYSAASSLMTAAIVSGTGTDGNLNAGFTAQATEASSTPTLTTSWQTFTLALAALPTAKTQLGVYFGYTPVGTAGAADYFEVTGVQLVVGTMAGTQIYSPFDTELARCQRYYWKTFPYATAPAQNAGNTGAFAYSVLVAGVNAHRWNIALPCPLPPSVTPVVTTYNPGAAASSWRNTTDALNSGAATAAIVGDRAVQILNPGVAGDAVGEVCQIHVTVDAEI